MREVLTKLATTEELQAAVLGIPGVVGAIVGDEPGRPPTVKVWVDDTRDPADLKAEVRALVARAEALRSLDGPPPVQPLASEIEAATQEPAAVRSITSASGGLPRRSGLGRGLESLLPDVADEPVPGHLVAIDLTRAPSLEMIAIEESASGVTVRAVDTAHNVAEAKVIGGASSVNPARRPGRPFNPPASSHYARRMDIACPRCGESEDLSGTRRGETIALTCGRCAHEWPRDPTARCPKCGGDDLQTVPLAIVEKSRGTQLSVVGTRPISLCSQCDEAKLAGYHRNRPNPLMPDELPNFQV